MQFNVRFVSFAFVLGLALCSRCLFAQTESAGQTTTNQQHRGGNQSQPINTPCPPATVCVQTQGDSTTPKAIPNPVVQSNKATVIVQIGPLSPIESCSLNSITSTPSSLTAEASLARIIGILLGTTIGVPTVPAGQQRNLFEKQVRVSMAGPLNQILDAEAEDKSIIDKWIARREAALSELANDQNLLTLNGRFVSNAGIKINTLGECLNEGHAGCNNQSAMLNKDKIDLEQKLQGLASKLTTVAGVVTGSNGDKNDLQNLLNAQAGLASLQNADTTLRAGEANMQAVYSQVQKVTLHDQSALTQLSDGLFETLSITPSSDSDMTASITCTSVIDNTTTFGPVPVSIHSGTPWLVYSAGGVVSLTPHQTVGEVAVADTSTTGFHNVVQRTVYDRFQVIPFAFLTALIPKTGSKTGFTGGIGFNPYSGVQGIDFFFGGSYRLTKKIYLHVGGHAGRFQDIDPKSGLNFNDTLPPTFPSTVPTRTRFTIHLAFGASYSF